MSQLAQVDARRLVGVWVVRVSGEVDLSNARQVMESIAGAVPSEAALVVVDLSDTSYLDSAGIAMIFRLAERLGHRRQELRLVVPADSAVRGVIELTNVPGVVPVEEAIPLAAEPG